MGCNTFPNGLQMNKAEHYHFLCLSPQAIKFGAEVLYVTISIIYCLTARISAGA
ncbi:hypothetical protein EC847_10690 [Scandinavium goeteborgense]|uniref:Uncharacterized protein n=1 Tax=Scandinavium goeteborgense TaxID=1851514 RepID=A0A4R6EHX3_SCAGO|nr:hypothetical protein EC847_10690 [Scandinavium goeteborgense]